MMRWLCTGACIAIFTFIPAPSSRSTPTDYEATSPLRPIRLATAPTPRPSPHEAEDGGRRPIEAALRPREGTLECLQSELEREGFIEPRSLELTESGRRRALELTRAHRLYELYLAEHSGYSPEDWHRLAHSEEHKLSEQEHERIALLLGNPLYDPHGDPIPTNQGAEASLPHSLSIEELTVGQWYHVLHIEDDEPESYLPLVGVGLTRDSVFRLDRLESARAQLFYEGEEIELPTFSLTALSLRPALPEEVEQGYLEQIQRLVRLEEGEVAEVVGLSPSCRGPMRRRLMDLGFVRGSSISIDMRSPLGNPTAYIVRGAVIALREDQARYILIQRPTHDRSAE